MAKSPPITATRPSKPAHRESAKAKAAETPFEPRGPEGHEMRTRILESAEALFEHFGFEKTSVADIAREVGISSAYVYRFFNSKAAVGEAVSDSRLHKIQDGLWGIARKPLTANEKFKLALDFLKDCSIGLFFKHKRLHELTAFAIREQWPCVERHKLEMKNAFRHIIMDGQAAGEFAKGDADADAAAVVDGLYLVAHPLILEEMYDDDLDARVRRLAAFYVRALRAGPPEIL